MVGQYKCRECGKVGNLDDMHYLHLGAHFCNREHALSYWNYTTDGRQEFIEGKYVGREHAKDDLDPYELRSLR